MELYRGKHSQERQQALEKANAEYEIFNKTQPIESDFDRAVKEMLEGNHE